MDKDMLARFAQHLKDQRRDLDRLSGQSEEARQAVGLDQQSVGRVSRIDAMQRQAMAKAQERQRARRRLAIEAALWRMQEGEYGFCVECGDEIALKRLSADPAVALCIRCASANE